MSRHSQAPQRAADGSVARVAAPAVASSAVGEGASTPVGSADPSGARDDGSGSDDSTEPLRILCGREQVFMMIGVWLAVYPSVTLLTYAMKDIEAATFIKTFCTTILTVPFITFIVSPLVKRLIKKGEEEI